MPFLLLFLLTLACLQPEWPAPPEWLGSTGSVTATWVGVALVWLWAALMTFRYRRRLLQEPDLRAHWMNRFAAVRRYHFLTLLVFFLATLFLGWGWTVKPAAVGRSLPGLELLLLAPMVFGLVGSWALFYPMERAVHDVSFYPESSPFLGRWAYIKLQARHNLLLVVPPLALLLFQQMIFQFFPGLEAARELLPVLGIGLLFLAFVCIPYLLRLFLGLTPLPAGPLRDRLEAAARRVHFRYSDILVWNTRNTVANAMVTGVVPWVRYIVVTDRLLEALTPDEIEGVFGHEVGHIKHHHMAFYLLFMLSSLVGLGGLGYLASSLVEQPEAQAWLFEHSPFLYNLIGNMKFFAVLPFLLLFAVYMFVVFGFLSRRCERQADIYGCRSADPQAFISALEKVALLNGIPRDKPGWLSCWQHGSIADRVAFLETLTNDPAAEPRFQRRLHVLKWGVLLLMVVFSTAVLVSMDQILGSDELWKFLQQL